LIKPTFGVTAIPVSEDIRSDQVANPSADGPSRRFFLFATGSGRKYLEILFQIHPVGIGERADDPIAPKTSARTELIVASAAASSEPTATARCGFGCELRPEDVEIGGMIDVPQAITTATIKI